MKKVIVLIGMAGLAAVFLISGYQIFLIMRERQSAEAAYEKLERFAKLPEQTDEAGEEGAGKPGRENIIFPEVDFDSLREINSQVVGWIYGEDTAINYPIVQAEDNSRYLSRMFDGQKNANGCIFLDCGNQGDFTDSHSIIYGHHMKSGAMFAGLSRYKSQEYYEEHPRMLLMTPEGNYSVELFAGYVADVKEDAWQIGFASEEAFEEWITMSISKSCISTDMAPTASDRILTLSTCSYEFENARFVLLGILRPQVSS